MRKQLLILIITTFSSVSYAQVRFEKGYFIDNSNQVIECQIKNADWKNNPTEFEYKLSENGEPQKATIESVKEFSVYNRMKYIRSTVDMDRSSNKPELFSSDRNPIFNEEVLFLKVLVEGKSDLYEFIDKDVTRYFFKNKDASIEQLVFKNYTVRGNKVGINNTFRQQLLTELRCQNEEIDRIKKAEYRKKDLVKLFEEHSRCNNNEVTHFKQGGKKEFFNLSLRPRLNSSKLTLEYIQDSKGNVVFDNKLNFGLGIETEFILPFHNKKWGLFIEPTYQYFKGEKETHVNNLFGDAFITEIDYRSIDFPVGLRHYFHLTNNSKIFVSAAYIFSWEMKLNIKTNKIAPDGTIQETGVTDINRIKGFNTSSDYAFGLGAGYKYNDKFSLEIRHQQNGHFLSSVFEPDYKTLSVILGYTLFK